MANSWFLGRNGQEVGPFTIYQVKQLAALNLVEPGDNLRQDGSSRWVPANSLTWLTFAPAAEKYFVNVGGKAHGPYTVERVRAAILSGRLPPEALACPQDGEKWAQVQQMTEFQSSLPTTLDTPQGTKRVAPSDRNQEEAELYLAGKRGDSLARLISSLLGIRRTHDDNPALLEVIDRNIHSLRELRQHGNVLV